MTLREYADSWLTQKTARLKPNAVRSYRSALMHHVIPGLGDAELAALTTVRIRRWLQVQFDAGRVTNSVRAAHAALSTVLMDAVLDGLIPTNVAHGAGRRLWDGRGKPMARKALKAHELAALLDAARRLLVRWPHDLFTLAAKTGLRVGELLALRVCHVLFDEGVLRVEQAYHGNGRFGPTKNGKARLVELSPGALELLARLVDQAGAPNALLFPGRVPGQPLNVSTVAWVFDRAVTRAGLVMRFTMHDLRHTYCSTLLAHGAPAQWVQRQVGHANYATTVDVYGSWLREPRPDLVAILDREPEPPAQQEEPRSLAPDTRLPEIARVVSMAAWRRGR